jgi:hypothetical protein
MNITEKTRFRVFFLGGDEAQPVLTTSISKDFIYLFREKIHKSKNS